MGYLWLKREMVLHVLPLRQTSRAGGHSDTH